MEPKFTPHAIRYGFAMTPERLRDRSRSVDAIEAIASLGEVAGNHSRFLFDFSPESIVLRITDDPAPRLLYCFEHHENGLVHAPELVRRIRVGDILPSELYIGGLLADDPDITALKGVHVHQGVKAAVTDFSKKLTERLKLPTEEKQ